MKDHLQKKSKLTVGRGQAANSRLQNQSASQSSSENVVPHYHGNSLGALVNGAEINGRLEVSSAFH